MVAYSFQPRFSAPIEAGIKRQTIRGARRRHARPGETLQLYTGLRTRACRLIGLATCTTVSPIYMDLARKGVVLTGENRPDTRIAYRGQRLCAFARLDGFDDWPDLTCFWALHHPGIDVFQGWLIRWNDLRTPALTEFANA